MDQRVSDAPVAHRFASRIRHDRVGFWVEPRVDVNVLESAVGRDAATVSIDLNAPATLADHERIQVVPAHRFRAQTGEIAEVLSEILL
jgi:hypothetical protein